MISLTQDVIFSATQFFSSVSHETLIILHSATKKAVCTSFFTFCQHDLLKSACMCKRQCVYKLKAKFVTFPTSFDIT